MRIFRRSFFIMTLILTFRIFAAAADAENVFLLPDVGQIGTWEAEKAQMQGEWKLIKHPSASGGAYIMPASAGKSIELDFAVKTLRPVSLRVYPSFGEHSGKQPVRRFPYPLEHRSGPDVMDWWQIGAERVLFFTSPETGRIVAFDPEREKVIGSVTVGGFLADLIVDRKMNRIYAADSVNDRIIIIDPSDFSRIGEIPVSGAPWSLALDGQMLYAGCLKGKKVVLIDTAKNSVLAESSLPGDVAHVEIAGEKEKQVMIWLEPALIDMESLKIMDADREQYEFARRTSAESGERNKPGYTKYSAPSPHTLRIDTLTEKGWTQKTIDVKNITGTPKVAEKFPSPLKDAPGPDVMVALMGKLFFTSPSTGKLGVLDIQTGDITGNIDVGGYLSDIAPEPSGKRLFVSDALGNRIVVIDAAKQSIESTLNVPEMPVALEMFIPPGWLKGCQPSLFAACWDAKKVVNISTGEPKIISEVDVPANPLLLKTITSPYNDWWTLTPSDRFSIELCTRLAVFLSSPAFKSDTLQESGLSDVRPGFSRRLAVSLDMPKGMKKKFMVDNAQTIQVSLLSSKNEIVEERWVDVSSLTDTSLAIQRPLSKYDQPGPMTVSLDNGPEYPWRREIWMTPDQEQFLVESTNEFWQWNASTLDLKPGKHIIKVRAYSPFLQLDALKVERNPESAVRLNVTGVQSKDIPEKYRSIFYHNEPVRFDIELENLLGETQAINMIYEVRNYMDEVSASGSKKLALVPEEQRSYQLEFPLKETGTFTLVVTISSPFCKLVKEHRFVRIPELEHPRMLFRKEDIPQIEAGIAAHPILFSRYFEWLRRQCEKEGFLPAGITRATFVPELPEEQRKMPQEGAWRRYDFGWRMIAVQFGAMFAKDAGTKDYFRSKIREILKDARTDGYCIFHHHGPFFPGAVATLFDLVAATPGEADDEVEKLRVFFNQSIGDMNVFPWMLASIEEPLSVRERAILWHVGMWLFNADRYFTFHQGTRGGQRWINDRTGCHCPYAGYGYSFIYLSNILKERRFHEKKLVEGFLTHTELIHLNDNRDMLGPVGPRGEPLRWIDSVLSRHPLEKNKYNWEGLLEQLESEKLAPETMNKLLAFKEEVSTSNPMAFVVPIALAIGWYDPKAPEVEFKNLPSTIFFDAEGDTIMRSGWEPDAAEVYFTCGIRDHVYRHQPTHLEIVKGGEFMLGTASAFGDDGNPNVGKTWGNVIVIEPSNWIRRWGENLRHPRAEEYVVINRFSDSTFRYINRDRRLVGYAPAESGWGGGLDLHGHTESLLLKEGTTIAYETYPEFDYVAGDATNSWDTGLAQEVYRQVAFVKPDVIVVYDRVLLGAEAQKAYWIAATGPQTDISGNQFTIKNNSAIMQGQVFLPENPVMQTYNPKESNKYNTAPPFSISSAWFMFDGRTNYQKVLEIHPSVSGKKLEYLIIMQIGEQKIKAEPIMNDRYAGVGFETNGKRVKIQFLREGPVGGNITLSGKKLFEHSFVQKVDDSYRHWAGDPRFKKWMSEPEFKFLHLSRK